MKTRNAGASAKLNREEEPGALKKRYAALDLRQLDKEKREIPISFSSETREVMAWDYELGGYAPEILSHASDACDLSPLLNAGSILRNHDVNQLVGAPTEAAIDEQTKRGIARMRFGRGACAMEAFNDVSDGILRGVSVGYSVQAYERVRAGGKSSQGHDGPCMLATRWSVHELTLTPCPADSSVGVGRTKGTPTNQIHTEEGQMDKEFIFAMVRTAGLDKSFAEMLIGRGLSDVKAVEAAIMDEKKARSKKPAKRKKAVAAENTDGDDDNTDEDDDEDERGLETQTRAENRGAVAERGRISGIRDTAKILNIDEKVVDDLIDRNVSLDKAREELLNKHKENDVKPVADGARGVNVERGGDGGEKKLRFLQANIGRRAFAAMGQTYDDESTKGIERSHVTLQAVVRDIMELRGLSNVRYMEPYELWQSYIRSQVQSRGAANTSNDLSNALSAIQNKSLARGFNMAKPTWPAWARKGSLNDFKIAPWVQMSGAGQLRETGENGEILDSKVNDRAENRQLAVYARRVSMTWESFQNDDLDAIGRAVFNLGLGAAKLPSRLMYVHLLSNPTMSDGVAFFHASHNNLLTGATSNLDATNKIAALAAAVKSFRKQVEPKAPNDGEFVSEPIDIDPGVMLVPPEHEYNANTLVNPNMYIEGSTFFKNKYQIETESRLSNTGFTGYSLTGWYLAARAAEMDTAEVSFLNGNENPLTAQWEEFGALAQHFRAVLACAAKMLDWRGMVRSDGA